MENDRIRRCARTSCSLHDDYWNEKGRKSVDAAAFFAGLLSISVIASEVLDDAEQRPAVTRVLRRLDIRRALPVSSASQASSAPS